MASSSSNEAWLCEKRNGSMGLLDPSNAEELLGKLKKFGEVFFER